MPKQTELQKIVYPDGLHFGISDDDGASFADVGVMGSAVQFTLNGELTQVFTQNAGATEKVWRNMSMAVAPGDLLSWDSSILEKIMGGLFVRTAVAGTPVVDDLQIILPGYVYSKIYNFEKQQASGAVPSAISLAQESAVGSGVYSTPLVLDTDYHIVRNGNGEWGVVLLDTATVDNTLGVQITYSYTPAAGAYLKAGTTRHILSNIAVRFRHYTDTDLGLYDFEVYLYKVSADPGSLVLNKRGANEDGVDTWTIGLTADIDTDRTDKDQLVSIFMNN